MPRPPAARSAADACPGALRPHHAADGDLIRLRLPGGALDPAVLVELAGASEQFADGFLGLTSRGNVQLRGVDPAAVEALARRIRAAGLLPSSSHERVRNIIASPLSGRRPESLASIDALAGDLDAALCLRPGLAALPGRFLFAVDDGSGDVTGEGADVLLQARGAGQFAVLLAGVLPGGSQAGLVVPEVDTVSTALAAAEAFLAERAAQGSTAWRLAELTDGPARVLGRILGADHDGMVATSPGSGADLDQLVKISTALEPGLAEQVDGLFAVCVIVPLGLLTQEQARAIAAAAQLSQAPERGLRGALRVTPWRRIVLRDLELPAALAARELLDATGLVVTPGTAWNRVTACAGQPGCVKAHADVHADAAAFVAQAKAQTQAQAQAEPDGPAVHWAGCERGCGTPSGPVVVAIATGHRYEVAEPGLLAPAERAWIGSR